MPTISFDVTPQQMTRLQAAFGKGQQPATEAEVLQRIKLILKRQVMDFEAQKIRDKANADVEAIQF